MSDRQLLITFSLAAGRSGSGGNAGHMQQELLFFFFRKMSETVTHAQIVPNNRAKMSELPTSMASRMMGHWV